MADIHSDALLEKTGFLFSDRYQSQIISRLWVGLGVHFPFSVLGILPGSGLCRPCVHSQNLRKLVFQSCCVWKTLSLGVNHGSGLYNLSVSSSIEIAELRGPGLDKDASFRAKHSQVSHSLHLVSAVGLSCGSLFIPITCGKKLLWGGLSSALAYQYTFY